MDTPLPPMNPEVARLRRQSAQRKFRKRLRHVRLLWTIAFVLLLLFLMEVLIALSFSPRFWIYRISVHGQETLTKGEVIRLMHLPEHSNFYRVSLGEMERRISAEQRVASVRVRRSIIGALTVDIYERQAVCQLGYSIPTLYMDAQQYVFTRPTPPTEPVPVVEGITVPSSKRILGKQLKTAETQLVLDCLNELNKASGGVDLDIARITIADKNNINLVLRQGTLVYIGPPDDLATKAWWVKTAIVQASKEGHALEQLDYINVRFVNRETGVGPTFHVKDVQEENNQP
ncbi:MAG TPA: FtsQ-type POTRA domain-containing protein [Armatimonadota bacterium]|nr:FtsQ-type POTRA domain-containing protein [Armatimonadota bacterium]